MQFGPTIQFIPATEQSPKFKLRLQHLLTSDQLRKRPELDANSEREFIIKYINRDLERALSIMDKKKKRAREAEQVEQEAKRVKLWSDGDEQARSRQKRNLGQHGGSGSA
jgi:hypothetical protein